MPTLLKCILCVYTSITDLWDFSTEISCFDLKVIVCCLALESYLESKEILVLLQGPECSAVSDAPFQVVWRLTPDVKGTMWSLNLDVVGFELNLPQAKFLSRQQQSIRVQFKVTLACLTNVSFVKPETDNCHIFWHISHRNIYAAAGRRGKEQGSI